MSTPYTGGPAIGASLLRHAAERPQAIALESDAARVSYGALVREVGNAAGALRAIRPAALGLLADNGVAWAVADLAALVAGVPVVPIPSFFTAEQAAHVIETAGIDVVLTDDVPRALGLLGAGTTRDPDLAGLATLRAPRAWHRSPAAGAAKLTFTSGTTGTPKGVLLSAAAQAAVAASTAHASGLREGERHVSLLPLPLLLENVAGLYRAIVAGATAVLPRLADVGLTGSSACDAGVAADALRRLRAHSAILVPQVLADLVQVCEDEPARRPRDLRFLGVGGARVSPALLHRAARAGLPVFEGYGLSEATSVVALNTPAASRLGSVGRVLPHASVEIAADGEIVVRGATFSGYVGSDERPGDDGAWGTGDLGHIDDEGYLFVRGRRRNVLITAYGRNVSPEWLEALLTDGPAIDQAAVVGDGRPKPVAVIHCAGDPRDAADTVRRVNSVLPDYARLGGLVFAQEPFSVESGLLDSKGMPRRSAVERAYLSAIEDTFSRPTQVAAVISED